MSENKNIQKQTIKEVPVVRATRLRKCIKTIKNRVREGSVDKTPVVKHEDPSSDLQCPYEVSGVEVHTCNHSARQSR